LVEGIMGAHVSRTARWLRRGVGLLLVLALLVCGVGWGLAQDKDDKKDEPKKEEPKKEEPKKEEPKKPDRAELLKQMEEARKKFQKIEQEARQQIDKAREEMQKEMAELQRQLAPTPPVGPFTPPGVTPGRFFPQQPRLGVLVDPPGEAMAEQLGLEKGKGVVVTDVLPDSAAAKAGLKKYDVLVEFNGKPVPASREGFAALVQEAKGKTPVEVEVIRKGKKETIKDVTLPEAPAARPAPAPLPVPRRGLRLGTAVPAVRLCGC
jgi:C-terminal processing protease CtpA/Prc